MTPPLSLAAIVEATALDAGLMVSDLTGERRTRPIALARHRAMWLSRQLRPSASYPMIARALHRQDHTTAIHGVRHYAARRLECPFERARSDALIARLAPEGVPRRCEALEPSDARLVSAALAGCTRAEAAAHAGLSYQDAQDYLRVLARALATTAGCSLIPEEAHSGQPEALILRLEEPPTPEAAMLAKPVVPATAPPAPQPAPERPPPPSPAVAAPRSPPAGPLIDDLPPARRAPAAKRQPLHVGEARPTLRNLVALRSGGTPKGLFAGCSRPEPSYAVPAPAQVSISDRALIDAAIAAGKVRQVQQDGTSELVFDGDRQVFTRLPTAELEKTPGSGWTKPSAKRRRGGWG